MSMIPFFTNEPMVLTVQNDTYGYANYTISRVNGMQDNTVLSTVTEYAGRVFAPDGNDDVNFGPIVRTFVSEPQERNIRTLQFRNSQGMGITQSTYAFNSYYIVEDSSSRTPDTWSVLYDTRGLTAYEAGARLYNYTPGSGYVANLFPDPYIKQGQYVSMMWRNPSNYGEMETHSLGLTYCYLSDSSTGREASREQIDDARASIDSASKNTGRQVAPPDPGTYGYTVVTNHTIDSSLTGQSFRYSGTADWQDWCENHGGILWARFWFANSKGTKTYITPYLYPRWCDEPDTIYLYYVNSMGGIDFIRGTYTSHVILNTEREKYETDADIDNRFEFGNETFSQRRWNSYTVHTDIVTDAESFSMADLVNTRWAWVMIPDDTVQWRSVIVKDTDAKVKKKKNENQKIYSYVFNLEDSIKNKIV